MKRPTLNSEIKDLNKKRKIWCEEVRKEEADDDEQVHIDSSRGLLDKEEDPATERISEHADFAPQEIEVYENSMPIRRLL